MQELKAIIAPSLLSCDFGNLEAEVKKIFTDGADWVHIDVMDFNFVPNLSIGPMVIKSLRNKIQGFFDCHLMVQQPSRWVEEFAKAGADQFTFHYEADLGGPIQDLIQKIKDNGMKVGLALKPETEVNEKILGLLDQNLIDNLVVLTVEPGFGGQSFMKEMMGKVRFLRDRYKFLNICVDGGIKCENIDIAAEAGANVIVSGTGIINHKNPKEATSFMKQSVQKQLDKN